MYDATSGLLRSDGTCMLADQAGFIYACTEQGLFAFDGRRFSGLGPDQGLPSGREVLDLALSATGRIAVRYRDGLWIADQPTSAHVPPAALHFRLAPLPSGGTLWFHSLARWDDGLVAVDGNELRLISVPASGPVSMRALTLPSALRFPAAERFGGVFNIRGDMWIIRSDKAVCVWNKAPRCFGPIDGLPHELWLAAAAGPDGSVLLRSAGQVASLAPDQTSWKLTPLPDQGDAYGNYPEVLDFFPTPHGGIATQADHGIAVLRNGRWQVLGTGEGALPGVIGASVLDRSGSLWLQIFGQGVARWVAFDAWQSLTHADGLSGGLAWESARTEDGSVWLATDSGIDQIGEQDDRLVVRRRLHGASYAMRESAGQIWAGNGEGGGLRVIDPATGTERFLPLPNPLAFVAGRDTSTWVATIGGLYRCYAPGSAAIACAKVADGKIRDIADDGAGGLFYAAQATLHHVSPNGENTTLVDHWPVANFDPSAMARSGTSLWIGGVDGGLLQVTLRGSAAPLMQVVPPSDYAGNAIVALLPDSRGWLWVGTDAGLSVFDGRSWVSLDTEDGLLSDDLDQRGLREDPDRTIWITSSAGISHLLKPERVFAPHQLDVAITRASFDDHLLRSGNLPFTRKPLTIDVGTPSYPAEQSVTFRYRMVGVDDDWIETSNSRIIYPFVPPGRHKFTVFAYDRLKHRVSTPQSLTIDIAYPWWRRWWSETLWSMGAIGVLYGLFRLRVRSERTRQAELERRVEEVTAEIRQAQAALAYQATHDQLTGLLNRSEVESRLAGFLRDTSDLPEVVIGLVDIDHFKAINDGWGHLTGDSVLREMGALAAGVLRADEFAGRYGGEEILVVLRNGDGRAVSRLAEFHQRVRTHSFSKAGTPGILNVTCSIGLAAVFGGDNWETLIGRADRALYHAKRSGRDRIAGLAGSTGSNDADIMHERARSGDAP